MVGAGLLLTAPSLTNGVGADDHFQRAFVRGYGSIRREPWDLFRFVSDDPAERRVVLDRGVLPWSTSAALKTAFFRPLSSLSVYADYALLPDLPWLFHLENLALYAALIALALALYRSVLPSAPIAALAGLLFAIDEAHGVPIGWIANRNALFASVFSVAAILLHHRGRRALASICLGLAVCSGEVGVGAFGYLVAYALTLDPAPLRRRLIGLLPYAALILGWRIAVRQLGFGVRGSGYYVDPGEEPLRFLATFPVRFVELTIGQLALPASDLWIVWGSLALPLQVLLFCVGVAVLGWLGAIMFPLIRGSRPAQFFALGAILAIVPATATVPTDRNLLLAGVGGFGLIALVIGNLVAPEGGRSLRWLRKAYLGIHLVLAPLLLPGMSMAMGFVDRFARGSMSAFEKDPAQLGQTVILMNMPNLIFAAFYWATPSDASDPVPARVRALGMSDGAIDVRREDERTIILTHHYGLIRDPTTLIVRDPSERFREGHVFDIPGVAVGVLGVDEQGRPAVLRCRFELPLEDPSLRWLAWDGSTFIAYRPPAVGAENQTR